MIGKTLEDIKSVHCQHYTKQNQQTLIKIKSDKDIEYHRF